MVDHHGRTCLLASTLILEFLGAIFASRGRRNRIERATCHRQPRDIDLRLPSALSSTRPVVIVYVFRRLLAILAILVVMSMLIFTVTQVLPGNVAYIIAGQFATPDVVDAIEQKLGLNDPAYLQYWRWASRILLGDLGQSMVMERPVWPLIRDALAASVGAGRSLLRLRDHPRHRPRVLAAVRQNRPVDHGVSIFTYLGISVPEFFWGIVLILVFARALNWLPAGWPGRCTADGILGRGSLTSSCRPRRSHSR